VTTVYAPAIGEKLQLRGDGGGSKKKADPLESHVKKVHMVRELKIGKNNTSNGIHHWYKRSKTSQLRRNSYPTGEKETNLNGCLRQRNATPEE